MSRRLTGWGAAGLALAGLLLSMLLGGQQAVLVGIISALVVGLAAEVHARLHPGFGRDRGRGWLDGFWIGPSLTVLAGALVLARMQGEVWRFIPFLGAFFVGLLLFAQHRELEHHPHERWTPLASALVIYIVAFVLFVIIYSARDVLVLAALASWISAALLGVALFRPSGAPRERVWLFAALSGLGVAQLTLALGTWVLAGLLGGAFLLLYFYVAAGLIQALLDGSLDNRLTVEYGLVGLVGLVLILSTSPWRS